MDRSRRQFAALAGLSVVLPRMTFAAEKYPGKPIRIIVPYTPGSGPDILARSLAEAMGPKLGQSLYVENRLGASGNIGVNALAKSPADGYTIGIVTNAFPTNAILYPGAYDPQKDFSAIGLIARGSMVLVTKAALGAADLSAFVRLAKSRAKSLAYSSPGSGSPQHLAMALLQHRTGATFLHVPYKGSGPAVAAVLAGEVDCMFMPVHTAAPLIKEGRVQAIAVSAKNRSRLIPKLATVEEAGLKGFDTDLWYALLAPSGTPEAVMKRLQEEVETSLKDPKMVQVIDQQGLDASFVPPEKFNAFLRAEIARWGEVIRSVKVVVD